MTLVLQYLAVSRPCDLTKFLPLYRDRKAAKSSNGLKMKRMNLFNIGSSTNINGLLRIKISWQFKFGINVNNFIG